MSTSDSYGLFWDSDNGDRVYNAESFETWLKKFFTTGVFANELFVSESTGMSLSVGSGYCNLDGKIKFFDTSTVSLNAAHSTYPRYDTVVIERNDTDRNIILKVVTGAYSGSEPVPTAPVRTGGVYQIVIAKVYVGAGVTSITQANITDTREDTDICGIVTGTVDSFDFEQFTAQYTEYFNEWMDTLRDVLDENTAGHLQNEIEELVHYTINTTSVYNYDSWNDYPSHDFRPYDLLIVNNDLVICSDFCTVNIDDNHPLSYYYNLGYFDYPVSLMDVIKYVFNGIELRLSSICDPYLDSSIGSAYGSNLKKGDLVVVEKKLRQMTANKNANATITNSNSKVTTLNQILKERAPATLVQKGSEAFSAVSGNSGKDVSIVFDAEFDAEPIILISLKGGSQNAARYLHANYYNASSTGFTVYVYNSSSSAYNGRISWVAMTM